MSEDKIPEINIKLESVKIEPKIRKLKSKWYCKSYRNNAVIVTAKYKYIIWYYNIRYFLFPPKINIIYHKDLEKEFEDFLIENKIKEKNEKQ